MDKNHPEIIFGKTGILLINLGTPDSTSWWDIRKYLNEFLSDRRVIEVNPVIWQIILNLFILTFRPSKTAKAYKKIWMNDINKSPITPNKINIIEIKNVVNKLASRLIEIFIAIEIVPNNKPNNKPS